MPVNVDLLRRGLAELSLNAEGTLCENIVAYVSEIERRNPALSLVGASGDELIVKHILDSLAPIATLRGLLDRVDRGATTFPGNPPATGTPRTAIAPGARTRAYRIADLGTGAGLPGIPLALAMPDCSFALIDRMTRRTRFLEAIAASLATANVEVVEEQVEHVRREFDLVVFRAFRPFERKLFKRVFALCAPEGFVAAYKGKAEKAKSELDAIAGLYRSAEILPVRVPFLEDERSLVILRPA